MYRYVVFTYHAYVSSYVILVGCVEAGASS